MEDKVRELRSGRDELSKLKLDIIRVLAIFNGVSWASELIPDIVKLRGGILDYPLRDDLLEKALHDLESEDLILTEPRLRGMITSRRTYEDKLVKLRDLKAAKRALVGDEIYRMYLSRQMEIFRRALEDRGQS